MSACVVPLMLLSLLDDCPPSPEPCISGDCQPSLELCISGGCPPSPESLSLSVDDASPFVTKIPFEPLEFVIISTSDMSNVPLLFTKIAEFIP